MLAGEDEGEQRRCLLRSGWVHNVGERVMKAARWLALSSRRVRRSGDPSRMTCRPLDRRRLASTLRPFQRQHPAVTHFVTDVAEHLPHFRAHSSDIHILNEPAQFYQTLLVRHRPYDAAAELNPFSFTGEDQDREEEVVYRQFIHWQGRDGIGQPSDMPDSKMELTVSL